MLCPAATAKPLPCLSTSVVSALGAGVFGMVSVGFSPKPPVTDTPTLVVAPLASVDDEEEDEPDDPQATRVAGVSRQAATRTALAGFGRRAMDVEPADLAADVLYQLAALDGLARAAGTRARYVKPHGALYHRLLDDDEQADAVVSAITTWDADAAVLTQPGELAR